jgi:DNA-binding transcriptional LysR family regulator
MIAANEATCIYVLPWLFSEYKKQFPNVQLHVDRSYGSRVVAAVLDNLADFGIAQLPIQDKKLQVVRIHSDEIKLLMPASHPLASQESALPQHLVPYPILLPKSDEIQVSMELDSTEMIKTFVMAGLGISFLAASHCRGEVDANRLAVVSLAPEPMIRRLGLIYRKDKSLSKAALGFINVIIEHAEARGDHQAAAMLHQAVSG